MKKQVRELSGAALDWAVAKAEGYIDDCNSWLYEASLEEVFDGTYKPSTDWSLGGPIIQENRIRLDCSWNPGPFDATCKIDGVTGWVKGSAMLVAAMRCFVTAKIGDEIEIPDF